VSLCRFHHRAVHEGGFDVRILDDGALRFVNPKGKDVDHVLPGCTQPPGEAHQLPAGKHVDCWRGDRMDLHIAVDLLIQQSRKAGDVPAGTSALPGEERFDASQLVVQRLPEAPVSRRPPLGEPQ
jgi:hypothetical protein